MSGVAFKVTSSSLGAFNKNIQQLSSRHIPYAVSLMLNYTALDIKNAQRKEMQRVFDNPTAFTLNSLYVQFAKRNQLSATVKVKDWIPKGTAAAAYLEPQVVGGVRMPKRFERQLHRRGLLPSGKVVVPGRDIRTNRSGNITRGQISKMMSNVSGHHDPTQNTKTARKKYFVKKDETGLPIAIYVRRGRRKIVPFLVFVDAANYHKRYDFYRVANNTRDRRIGSNWIKAWRKAMSTAF